MIASNIVSGKSIFGVNGSASNFPIKSITRIALDTKSEVISLGRTIDLSKCIVITNITNETCCVSSIIDGVASFYKLNRSYKLTFTNNSISLDFAYSGTLIVTVIEFNDVKSIQEYYGTFYSSGVTVSLGGKSYMDYQVTITSVNKYKSIVLGFGHDPNNNRVHLPYIVDDTTISIGQTGGQSVNFTYNFVVVEFN